VGEGVAMTLFFFSLAKTSFGPPPLMFAIARELCLYHGLFRHRRETSFGILFFFSFSVVSSLVSL
jgi:hypothetical protein